MKKIYLLLAVALSTSVSVGQNNQPAPAQSVVLSSGQTQTQEPIQRPSPSILVAPFLTEINSLPTGEHKCFAHELNEAHYASRGILNEFNQSYLQSTAAAASMSFPETSGTNEISVIFHVVYNPNNPAENVSNALIQQVFQDLREDFLMNNADVVNARTNAPYNYVPVNSNINFCLATQDPFGAPLGEIGVVRVSTTEDWYNKNAGEENKMKAAATGGSQIWNRNKYLNVWICDISNGAGSGVAGYAYRPTPLYLPGAAIDGIVLDYNLGMNNDNILTHETGHYLGLDHTWGGSGGCGNDDGFTDTPVTNVPSQDTINSCNPIQQNCSGIYTQYENYMDYSNCTVMYTQEQANYMLNILQGIRGSLLLSQGCDPTNTPPVSAFTSIPVPGSPTIIPVGGSVSLIDQSTNVPTGWAWTVSGTPITDWNYINGTNATSQDPQVEFYTVGTYDVTLTASNVWGSDLTPEVENIYIQVAAAATGTGCDTLRNWNPAAGAGGITWSPPSIGYAHGNSQIGTESSLQWAEVYTVPTTTDIRAIEFAPVRVSDGGGSVIFKVWANNGGQPAAVPITTETVLLADINEGFWNKVEFTTPAVGVTGTIWVGYELSYNSIDTFALYSQQTTAANDATSFDGSINGWTTIATITGGGAGLWGLMDVLTSTGPAPVMDFSATDNEVCIGGDIIVNGSTSTNNVDYRWYVTDDPWLTTLETSSSAGNTFNFPYAAGSYSIYLFGSASCYDDGVVMPVSVYNPVSATVTPTATTCGNNNGSITVTAPLGGDLTTYYYSLDGVNYQLSNVFNTLAAGNYDVYIATLGNSCEAMYTVTVAASATATATISTSPGICPGGTATVTATGGGTYQWLNGSTPVGTGSSLTVSPNASTQYTCVVTNGGGCVAIVQTTVDVLLLPTAPVISTSGSTTICSGSSVDLTSSYPTNNLWSTAETSSTITVSSAGPVTLTYTDANGCVSNSSLVTTIVVQTAPTISSGTVTSPSTCGSSTGSIQVSGTGSGDVSWSGTAIDTANGVTLPYTIPNLAAGSYNITITDGNGCVSNILAQGLNDPTPPATPVISAGGAITFCDGGSVVLTSSYGSGNSWSTMETTANITVTTTQTISVTYTDGSGCSSTSAPIVVTVNANPTTPIITAGGVTTFCEGGSVNLTSSQGSGNSWSSSETTQTIVATTNGSYTVTYTNANGCSSTSAPTVVTVNPAPTMAFGTLADVCDYFAQITLSGATPAGGTYSGTGVTGNQFDPATAGLGTHTITYSYTDGLGCSNSTTQDIFVDACLSLIDQENLGLSIFPNPTTNELNIILSGEFNYEIVDARGRNVQSGSGSQNVVLNTSSYENGVYFVTISNNKDIVVTRVVKQ